MRQHHPICPPREYVGDACRVVVERIWRQRPSGNGHPAHEPVIIVQVHLVGVGFTGKLEDLIVLTPERFDRVARDFLAVAQLVQEAAREMLREPGTPSA